MSTLDTGSEKGVLAIVTGANGALGKAYLEELAPMPNIRSVGIVRESKHEVEGVEYRHGVDLLEQHKVEQAIASLRCEQAKKILLIHPVGKFKFEMQPPEEIDPEILLSNMATMANTVRSVMNRMRESTLVVCAFGSVSDKYNVPFWQSYTAAKNEVRNSLRTLSTMFSRPNGNRKVRSVIVNVSTTDTGNENALRPNADKTFWLQPKQIVDESLPILLADSGPSYQEFDVIQEKPGFDPEAYYENPDEVLAKWIREMGDVNS